MQSVPLVFMTDILSQLDGRDVVNFRYAFRFGRHCVSGNEELWERLYKSHFIMEYFKIGHVYPYHAHHETYEEKFKNAWIWKREHRASYITDKKAPKVPVIDKEKMCLAEILSICESFSKSLRNSVWFNEKYKVFIDLPHKELKECARNMKKRDDEKQLMFLKINYGCDAWKNYEKARDAVKAMDKKELDYLYKRQGNNLFATGPSQVKLIGDMKAKKRKIR